MNIPPWLTKFQWMWGVVIMAWVTECRLKCGWVDVTGMNSCILGKACPLQSRQASGVDRNIALTTLCLGFWRKHGQNPSASKVSEGKGAQARAQMGAPIKQTPGLPHVAVWLWASQWPTLNSHFLIGKHHAAGYLVLGSTLPIVGAHQVRVVMNY